MKELLIFRIFALFPLIGVSIPDVANKFGTHPSIIPPGHFIVDVTLIICICICTGGIWIIQNNALKTSSIVNPLVPTEADPYA